MYLFFDILLKQNNIHKILYYKEMIYFLLSQDWFFL